MCQFSCNSTYTHRLCNLVAIKSFLLATRIASEPKAHAAWFTPNVGVSQDHTSRVDHTSPQGQVKLHQ